MGVGYALQLFIVVTAAWQEQQRRGKREGGQ